MLDFFLFIVVLLNVVYDLYNSLFEIMVGKWVCMGSLTVELFLRQLCFWFVFAPGAFPGWADHCVWWLYGQCLLTGRGYCS
jgi:hypothetical protein